MQKKRSETQRIEGGEKRRKEKKEEGNKIEKFAFACDRLFFILTCHHFVINNTQKSYKLLDNLLNYPQ